jgi:hypothetical protein
MCLKIAQRLVHHTFFQKLFLSTTLIFPVRLGFPS